MSRNNTSKKKTGFKRTLMEWGGIAAVVAILYFTGLHTEVLGTMQRAMLWTGLFDAKAKEVTATNGPKLTENAYNMPLNTPGGKQVHLQDFKGKVLFINIWASWCPPCVAEMPTIETLYNRFSDNKDIKFLLISMDKKQKKAIDFMEGKDFPMPYYFPVSGLPQVFQSSYIPSTYVVSKEGQVIYDHGGIADYSSENFQQWLKEKTND